MITCMFIKDEDDDDNDDDDGEEDEEEKDDDQYSVTAGTHVHVYILGWED